MDIVVSAFDPHDDTAVEQAYRIQTEVWADQQPDAPPYCRQRFVGGLRHPMPGDEQRHMLAYLDGVAVGYLEIRLPQLENRENAQVTLSVLPAYRRRGVGRALYDHAVRLVRALGRKRLLGEVFTMNPDGAATSAGDAFAAGLGAHAALTDIRRRLDLTRLDEPELDRLLAASRARADGYTTVFWTGRTPDEYLADVAYLDSRLIEDAPLGDVTWEPPVPDATRIQQAEDALIARGSHWYNCGTRHDATGRLVAWTAINMSASSDTHAFQSITLVEPRHRGHRLGTLVKIENLRYVMAQQPALRIIDTHNAATNSYMISINEALGFRAVGGLTSWQVTL
ncbi:GNAT family N-acetyltransferase [Plantactinospora sp. B5E13]|uniref:GNAT family N-acetyltransferase n=1 Tax=unclassified Plantactinospora TaxID=2631981 RepID=UPI00325CF375